MLHTLTRSDSLVVLLRPSTQQHRRAGDGGTFLWSGCKGRQPTGAGGKEKRRAVGEWGGVWLEEGDNWRMGAVSYAKKSGERGLKKGR